MSPVKPASLTIAKLQQDILARLRADIDNLETCVLALDAFGQPVPEYDSRLSRFSLPAAGTGGVQIDDESSVADSIDEKNN